MTVASDNCPVKKCDGNGFIHVRYADGYTAAATCDCVKLKVMARRMEYAQIPKEFADLKVSDFDISLYSEANRKTAENAKKIAIGYVNNFAEMKEMGKGLYFYGEAKGSGKTRLAISVGNALIRQHMQSVRFVTTVNLLNEIKSTFSRATAPYAIGTGYSSPTNNQLKHSTYTQMLEDAKTVDVLILDDIGTEKPTEWVGETFYAILNDPGVPARQRRVGWSA